MELDNRFRRIARKVRQFLHNQGFVGKGQTFWREQNPIFPTVILKRSRWNTREECDFWFVIGVFIPQLYAVVFEDTPPPYPKEGCLLLSLGVDAVPSYPPRTETLSWMLRLDDSPAADAHIESDVLLHLRDYAVPFLDQFGSLFDVINYLEWLRGLGDESFKQRRAVKPSDAWLPIYLAVLYWMVGDFEKGLRELDALEREEIGQYFQEYIERLRDCLGR
ncbi:MAG: hypothetical protein KatS3mg019_0872 [Fimbriimonadales bacterium]|nr:MAG: hypothetical protein KatS3mg019_0872 [Fimbriimonadales bacterium]